MVALALFELKGWRRLWQLSREDFAIAAVTALATVTLRIEMAILLGTILSAAIIGQLQSTFEFMMTGSMAKASILLLVIVALYFRPNGLFASKVRR